jgi:hypothetical protein
MVEQARVEALVVRSSETNQATNTNKAPAPAGPAAHYCRRCRTTGDGPVPPAGWLRLQRRSGHDRAAYAWSTSGVYCGLDCLVADNISERP